MSKIIHPPEFSFHGTLRLLLPYRSGNKPSWIDGSPKTIQAAGDFTGQIGITVYDIFDLRPIEEIVGQFAAVGIEVIVIIAFLGEVVVSAVRIVE